MKGVRVICSKPKCWGFVSNSGMFCSPKHAVGWISFLKLGVQNPS